MKKMLCVLILVAFTLTICGCSAESSSNDSYVEELQSKIEYLEEENEALIYERNLALANAYMLHKLLEKRSGKEYLEEYIEEYDPNDDYRYCYLDYMGDFTDTYASNYGYDEVLYEEFMCPYDIVKVVESTYPLSTFDTDTYHIWK